MLLNYIEGDNLTTLYQQMLLDVLRNGKDVKPRAKATKELHPYIMALTNPVNNLIFSKERAINPLFMFSEFVWIMKGLGDVDFVSRYNQNMKNFSDDGKILNGAYGPRIRAAGPNKVDQLKECIFKLSQDHDTRQAMITIFDPAKDFLPTKDVPCNILLKFTIRDSKLDLTTYIRSQDMILGFPYDVYHWTALQQIVASILKIGVGVYYHVIDSAHIYDIHYDFAERIIKEDIPDINCQPIDNGVPFKDLNMFDALMNYFELSIRTKTFAPILSNEYFANVNDIFQLHHVGVSQTPAHVMNDWKRLLYNYKNRIRVAA